jgi:hypothetical protein
MERLPRSYVLAMLTNALPKGAALTSIQLGVKAARQAAPAGPQGATKHGAVASARKKRKQALGSPKLVLVLHIQGKASTDVQVARYIASLAKHPLTEMVDLSYSKEAQRRASTTKDKEKPEGSREFVLSVRLRADADALDGLDPSGKESTKATEVARRTFTGGGT